MRVETRTQREAAPQSRVRPHKLSREGRSDELTEEEQLQEQSEQLHHQARHGGKQKQSSRRGAPPPLEEVVMRGDRSPSVSVQTGTETKQRKDRVISQEEGVQKSRAPRRRATITTKFEGEGKRGDQADPEQAERVRSLGGKHLPRTEPPRSSPPSSLSRFLSSSTCAPSGKCG